ncbi:MAG: ABC transporter substrate-binding protein, partial [Ruminococcaceae bacterium]|nr:ABC transporter substrate-binding protein [Oscillospiraceae bacterium]
MKKLSFVLALLLICSVVFTGCGKKNEKLYDYELKEYV